MSSIDYPLLTALAVILVVILAAFLILNPWPGFPRRR
jgi:hypothetical protein